MRPLFRAPWVLPIDRAPVRDGWIAVENGRIVAVGGGGDAVPSDFREIHLTGTALLPGLVNAHAHLELSWMRDQVPPGTSMPAWAARLMALRRSVGSEPPEPILDAIREARASGTAVIGDVTNTLAACGPLMNSPLSAAVFRELLGFRTDAPEDVVAAADAAIRQLTGDDRLRGSVVPHAPYSVSPALFEAIAAAAAGRPISVHLGESREEVEFLAHGTGAWREILEDLGVWNPQWQPPRCGPVDYLSRFGLVNERLLAVHAVQLTDDELGRLAEVRATVVTCPRSNRWTGAGMPRVDAFYQSGVRVAIGTDSLASVEDLNLFHEMAEVRRLAPRIQASRILRSATLDGAEALGFGADLGSVVSGKRAELLAVAVPARVTDVEEYLLSGIDASQVSWVETQGHDEHGRAADGRYGNDDATVRT